MAEFSVIRESDAPRPSRQTGRLAARMREYEKYVDSVRQGHLGKLVPQSGESARGIALRISRAGKRTRKSITTWVVDNTVYFKVS